MSCMQIGIWRILRLCSVISSGTQLDIVTLCLACQTLEPENQGRFQGGHLQKIVLFVFLLLFSSCNAKLLHTRNMELYIKITKITLLNVLYLIILEIVGVGITLALMQDN